MEDWKTIRKRKSETDAEHRPPKPKVSKPEPDVIDLSSDESEIEITSEVDNAKNTKSTEKPICSSRNESNQPETGTESFIKYTKIDRLKSHQNSYSLKDILSIDKEQFIESVQFNYCHDIQWTLEQYPKETRSKPLLIVYGPSHQEPILKKMAKEYSNVTLCKAKLDIPYGTHHTKMMFLKYKHGMRVVVTTANLIEEDWELKTQGVWISELFPCLSSMESKPKITDSKTYFKSYLMMYLEHYHNPILNDWVKKIDDHDMHSANVFLVGSIPGRYPANKKLFGHLRLRKILSDHVEIKEEANNIISQFSSIGSLGPNENSWLCKELYGSFSCSRGLKSEQKLQPICIFPCVGDVRRSFEGYSAGTSIPYSIKTAAKQTYLNKFLYKWKADSNHRTRASPHIKSYARFSDNYEKMYWFLLTSSNLSKAAWGCYEKNESQLFIRSYELGVLFLPKFMTEDHQFFDTTDKNLKLPYDLPPVKYSENDKPWCYDVSYEQADSHGRVWNVGSR